MVLESFILLQPAECAIGVLFQQLGVCCARHDQLEDIFDLGRRRWVAKVNLVTPRGLDLFLRLLDLSRLVAELLVLEAQPLDLLGELVDLPHEVRFVGVVLAEGYVVGTCRLAALLHDVVGVAVTVRGYLKL